MNCNDVIAYVIEPGDIPAEAIEHLETCRTCREELDQSRRLAALMTELPAVPCSDIAGRVMSRIGYGNGRPTKDKVLDQLNHIRDELEKTVDEAASGETDWRPSGVEPSVADVLVHLADAETALLLDAQVAADGGFIFSKPSDVDPLAESGAGATSTIRLDAGHNAKASREDLRRVRERTLRFVSGLPDAGGKVAELLRQIYRHEGDHAAQIEDILWRAKRRSQVEGSL